MSYTKIPAVTGVGSSTNVGQPNQYPIHDPATTWYHQIPGSSLNNQPPTALAPTLAMSDVTAPGRDYVVNDTIRATVTTPDTTDGVTTTGVDIYESGVLVGHAVESPAHTWKLSIPNVTAGAKSYVARRIYTGGTIDSVAVTFTVLGSLTPDQITSATLLAWYRITESVRLHTTLQGTNTITIASASSLDGQTKWPRVDIKGTGNPGTGTFQTTFDDGASYNEGSPQTIPTGAGTYAVPNSDYTITFQQAVSYTNGTLYLPMCSALLDKVGAYPNSTNNLINDATNGGVTTRPQLVSSSNATNFLGSPVWRFNHSVGGQALAWNTAGGIATAFSGASKPMTVCMVCSLPSVPSSTVTQTFYCISNITSGNQPKTQLAVTEVTGEAPTVFAQRVLDDATNLSATSGANPNAGFFYIQDELSNAGARRTRINMADFIGGDSGIDGAEAGTITTTRFTVGCTQTQSGRANPGIFDLGELMIFNGPLSELESWRLAAYVLQ